MTTNPHQPHTLPVAWTPEEIDTLRRHVAAGLSDRMIADRHKRSIPSVKKQIRRQGLTATSTGPRRPLVKWTAARDTRLRELVAAGFHDAEIATAMQDSESVIRSRREILRLRLVQLPPPQEITPAPSRVFNARKVRNDRDITYLTAQEPAGCVLGDPVDVGGRELLFIDYRDDDGAAVCVDPVTKDVVVVGNG